MMWISKIWAYIKLKWKQFLFGTILIAGASAAGLTPQDTIHNENDMAKEIVKAQEKYIKTHDKYFQGLPTHKKIPTATSTLDNIDKKPSYQAAKWSDFMDMPKELPFDTMITQYVTPDGKEGYQIIFEIEKGTTTYQMSKGYGVEANSRTWSWKQIENNPE